MLFLFTYARYDLGLLHTWSTYTSFFKVQLKKKDFKKKSEKTSESHLLFLRQDPDSDSIETGVDPKYSFIPY